MPSLESFNDFVRSTGQKLQSGPDEIVNDATKNTYLLGRALKGRDPAQSVQSGQKIVDRIMLTDSGTAEFYHPNDDLDIQNTDNLVSIEVDWRFIADHYAYTQQEVTLNSGDPQTYYKNLLKGKRQACVTSTFNKMEDAMWAEPSNSQMENSSGRVPYSIPTFITPSGSTPTGFTTVQTLNPTTNPGWQNRVEEYAVGESDQVTDGVVDSSIVDAIDKIWHRVRFIAPQGGPQEYFESDMLQKMVIATNLDGITILQRLTRQSNDRLMPPNNLGWVAGNITYAGLPILYVSTLDDALVNSGSAMAEGKPWFYFINFEYLFPIFHTEKYMSEEDPMRHPRQPFSYVVWKQTYYNWFCQSRRRQGLVVPDDWDS